MSWIVGIPSIPRRWLCRLTSLIRLHNIHFPYIWSAILTRTLTILARCCGILIRTLAKLSSYCLFHCNWLLLLLISTISNRRRRFWLINGILTSWNMSLSGLWSEITTAIRTIDIITGNLWSRRWRQRPNVNSTLLRFLHLSHILHCLY